MSQESQNLPAEITPEDILQRAAIDKSTRLPVLFFFTSAAAWLIIATLLGLLASFKLIAPGFLECEYLSYPRVQPAFVNALVYGWAFQAGIGVMIWIMARLCRTELRNPITLVVAGHFWNLGVTLGVLGILGGLGNLEMQLLEFPSMVWPILLFAYTLVVVWMVIMYSARRKGMVYISQAYLLTAVFSWPWIYLVANTLLNVLKKAGVAGPAIASWYSNNVLFLWMVPVGLAAAYFIIPKITNRTVYSYKLSTLAFWGFVALSPWTGAQQLIGSAVPNWLPATAGTAQILLLIPMIAVALNHFRTVSGSHHLVTVSPSLRFTFFSAVGFGATCVICALLSSMSVSRFTFLSYANDAVQMTGYYMFFSFAMFGAIYFIVPRVTGCEWISGKWIRLHFWFNAYACIFLCIILLVAGFSHGTAINRWDSNFFSAIIFSRGYLVGRVLLWLFVLAGNFIFLRHLACMVMNRGLKAGQPTMIHKTAHTPAPAISTEPAQA